MSFCGNSLASGRRHDNMLSAFNTGTGGVTSSEILPNRSQGLKINMFNASNNEDKEILRITIGLNTRKNSCHNLSKNGYLARNYFIFQVLISR
jgi:hypothetical protein